MVNKREQAIELAGRIARLRQELETATEQLDLLLSDGQPSKTKVAGHKSPAVATERVVAGSLSDRILQLVQGAPDKKFGIDEIMKVAGDSTAQTVRSVVWRLAKKKRLSKAGRGRYRALAKEAAGEGN